MEVRMREQDKQVATRVSLHAPIPVLALSSSAGGDGADAACTLWPTRRRRTPAIAFCLPTKNLVLGTKAPA